MIGQLNEYPGKPLNVDFDTLAKEWLKEFQ